MPDAIMVAGPNGVGKSTYSLRIFGSGFLLLDPDRYGISPHVQDPITAGRLVVSRVNAAIASGQRFVLETTLSGQFPLKVLRRARLAGYKITLLYVGVDDVSECIARVRKRVLQGGHDVPEHDVRRRFVRSLAALPKAIGCADRVVLYDSSQTRRFRVVARSDGRTVVTAVDVPPWAYEAVAALRRHCGL